VRTVSFYSYKGGTGRTLLLANLAVYAARLGRTVVMVDLDLEAPGLAYKFQPSPTGKRGVLEWLSAPRRPDVAEMAETLEVVNPFNDGGALWLIGAGPPPSMDFLRDVRRLQSTAFADDSSRAVAGMLDLRTAIAEHFAPDFLFLDARTGISNTNAITTRVLAEDVVALTLDTREQLEGTRAVLQSLAPLNKPRGATEPLGLHVVVSRVTDPPRGVDETERSQRDADIVTEVRRFLTVPAEPLTATLTLNDDPLLLHNDAAVASREHILLAQRHPLTRSRPLHFDYLRVAERLFGADNLVPAVAEAFRDIDETQRTERAVFFGDADQAMDAKAPRPVAEIRPPSAGEGGSLRQKVDLLRRAVRNDPSRRPDLAEALVALAWEMFDARTTKASKALSHLREAERIYKGLADRHRRRYAVARVDVVIQRSAMAAQLGFVDEALSAAARAVDLVGELDSGEDFATELAAKALRNLAVIRYRVGDVANAVGPMREAVRIVESHAETLDPADLEFALQVANTYNEGAIIEAQAGDSTTALRYALRAVEIFEGCAEVAESPVALSYQAQALSNAANIMRDRFEFSEAIEFAKRATEILGDLAADEPQTYLEYLAFATQTLSAALADAGLHQQAVLTAEHSAHLWRELATVARGNQQQIDLISALNNLAARYGEVEQYADARRVGEEALGIIDSLQVGLRGQMHGDSDPEFRLLNLASAPALANLATTYRRVGEPRLALQTAIHAREIYEGLGKPFNVRRAEVLLHVAFLLQAEGRLPAAYNAVSEALELFAGNTAKLGSAHLLAARIQFDADPQLAVRHAAEALDSYTAVADSTGRALAMELLADAYTRIGDKRSAQKFRDEATVLRQEILTAPPTHGHSYDGRA
jgi:MinD-like ATPase involved in chromosome partitioning or flagellar assembly/tetratricopeptide (TPR) repeat protein